MIKRQIIIFIFVLCFIICVFYISKNSGTFRIYTATEKSLTMQNDYNEKNVHVRKNNESTSERTYIPLTLIAEVEDPDLHLYEGYNSNMDNFIWFTKYGSLQYIEWDYNIIIENKDKYEEMDCDYVISFGNMLSKLYYDNELIEDDEGRFKYIPYPVFDREHKKNTAYIYKLDKRYSLADPEYMTNMIWEINEFGVVPYDEKDRGTVKD